MIADNDDGPLNVQHNVGDKNQHSDRDGKIVVVVAVVVIVVVATGCEWGWMTLN